MFKTLFQAEYPFFYDLAEIHRYYLAYRSLMKHWDELMPGQIHQLSYENLVADQSGETRKLLEYCGLSSEDSCAEFHRNKASTTIASAVPVRKPICDCAISQCRHYAAELAQLRRQLESAGVNCD